MASGDERYMTPTAAVDETNTVETAQDKKSLLEKIHAYLASKAAPKKNDVNKYGLLGSGTGGSAYKDAQKELDKLDPNYASAD